MKYLKLFKSYREIESICKRYSIEDYTINQDGSIDVNGDVNFYFRGLTKLPIFFGKVSGVFHCGSNRLKSLEGFPSEIGGGFYLHKNMIKSLKGAPSEIGGDFNCSDNQLTSLEGCPKKINGDFHCSDNQLTSLEGCPSEVIDLDCSDNRLTTLKDFPKIKGRLYLARNLLPQEVYDYILYSKGIIYWQNDYNIWLPDGSLYKSRFQEMIEDIKEDLGK